MLIKKDIKKWANATIYSRGTDVYFAGHVKELDIDYQDNKVQITTQVKGSGRKIYGVNMSLDEEKGDLLNVFCECPAFYSYSGICKHCAAVLMKYIDESRPARPVTSSRSLPPVVSSSARRLSGSSSNGARIRGTTPELKQLLEKQTYLRTMAAVKHLPYGRIKLMPALFCDSKSIRLDFQIGETQMYVLKDVFEFASAMKEQKNVTYGKKLDFIHTLKAFDPEYRPLVKWLWDWAAQKNYGMSQEHVRSIYFTNQPQKLRTMTLGGQELQELLEVLPEGKIQTCIQGGGESVWSLTQEKLVRNLNITGTAGGIDLKLDPVLGYRGNDAFLYFSKGLIYRMPLPESGQLGNFLSCIPDGNKPLFIAKEDIPAFCRELLPVLKESFRCTFQNFEEGEYEGKEATLSFYLDAQNKDYITCKVYAEYDESKYNVYDLLSEAAIRDWDKEKEGAELASGYCNAYDENEMAMVLSGDEEKLYELLVRGVLEMQKKGTVFTTSAFKQMNIMPAPKITLGVSLSGNMLELTLNTGQMPYEKLVEVLSKYDRKKKYFRLRDGSFVNTQEEGLSALAELKQGLGLTDAQLDGGSIILPRFRALYLESELQEWPSIAAETNRNFRTLIQDMKTPEDNEFQLPENMDGILREYQKKGYLWLKTLHYNGFGGILADDMGLGKTLQVIAFLQSLYTRETWTNTISNTGPNTLSHMRSNTGPNTLAYLSPQIPDIAEAGEDRADKRCLIVTPASLVYNWKAEIEKFAPLLPVKMVIGSAQERMALIQNAGESEILITSYDLLKRDLEQYAGLSFACQIIDEAQYIKNHATQAAKAVKMIDAGFKLALTGTPVENRLSELWSIFDYLMPGLLYSYTRFRDELESPIVQNGDEGALHRLQKMIRPFILRRLKKDVLKDLPDKLEENMYAMLEGEQKELYDAHVTRLQMMLNKQTEEEFRTSKIQILAELTKLRQICCDPSLLMEGYKKGSAKSNMCMELLQNAVNGGHKVLLFSQFTTMLEHLSKRMDQEKISYFTLTGATSKEKRRDLVERFNQDDTSVFCISLKAGGTGLNLTAADIVIHFDPWWNLSVQNQATDRAHRIGQTNVVTVYKLIVKDTIEENIVMLQEKKLELAEQVLSGDNMGAGSFSREELLELLR